MPVSRASAEQRKGRAGRIGPGICFRWWKKSDFRPEFSPPEISEADLAPLVLETSLWGCASPWELTWLTRPSEAAVQRAFCLLKDLELLDQAGQITPAGREAAAFSVHPRLAKMMLDARTEKSIDTAVVMAALLENDDLLSGNDPDFRDRLSDFRDWTKGEIRKLNPGMAKRVWKDVCRLQRALGNKTDSADMLDIHPEAAGTLLLAAYPDRAAKKTRWDDQHSSRWLLASGRGAICKGTLAQEEFLAVAELDGGDQDARIFLAAPVSLKDLEAGKAGQPHETWTLEWLGWKPKARLELKLGAIVLKAKAGGLPARDALQQAALSRLRSKGLAELPWSEKSRRFLARCWFVAKWGNCHDWPPFADEKLLANAGDWLIPFGKWDGGAVWDEQSLFLALENYLGGSRKKQLDQWAPESFTLPSGSRKKIDYGSGQEPRLSARLQEFFGCGSTPKICGHPLLLELLSPAGQPVQLTRDLEGFWDRTYPEVKKELMGRYPRHYWPDNPRQAKATAKAKPRSGSTHKI